MGRFRVYRRERFEPDYGTEMDTITGAIQYIEGQAAADHGLRQFIVVDTGDKKPAELVNSRIVVSGYTNDVERPTIETVHEFISDGIGLR